MVTLLVEVEDPEKAQDAIVQMDMLAEEWALKLQKAEQELKTVEQNAGETVLASILQGNDGTGAAVNSLATARAQYDVAVKTLESIEHHQVIAKANLKLANAHQKRLQAAEKSKERDAHMQKVNALLDQLCEIDRAKYVPYAPRPLYAGEVRDPESYIVSLAETMRRQITDLIAEAEQLESSAKNMLAKVEAQRKKGVSHAVHG